MDYLTELPTLEFIVGTVHHQVLYIFNVPPATGFLWLLLLVYRSLYSPLIIFTFLLGLNAVANKLQNKIFSAIATILALGVTVLPVVYWLRPGSVTAFNLAVTVSMVIAVFALGFVKFTVLDYTVLFSCFFFIARFHGVAQPLTQGASLFGISSPALFVLVVLLAMYKIRLKTMRGSLFYCWFTFVITFIYGYAASNLLVRHVVPISQAQGTWAASIGVWALLLLAVGAASAVIFHVMNRLFKKHFDNINRMGKAYPQIERFFIYNSVGILVFMAFLHSIYGQIQVFVDPVTHSFSVIQNPFFERSDLFLLFAMVLQLSFLIMIFRITWLKDNLHNKAMESQSLAAYSSSLEKNMNDIRHIKHDIKNIFLTMGNFV
ncbi:MAG: hypothetical protein FWG38_09895, partial [Defluviitaleaceae bacterium]|nr:hypothetical protein [Defluviitaleaceae bacterium]